MTEPLYINASCIISGSKNAVIKNNEAIFSASEMPAAAFLTAGYDQLNVQYPRFYKMDNLSKLGWLATEILLKESFNKDSYQPEDIGLVFSNRNSSLDTDIKYYETVKTIASPALFVYTLPNIVLGEICIRHNFKGENDFFIFESFNAGFIQQYVSHLFATNAVEACICGWVEMMDNDYGACLFLVEKINKAHAKLFTEENMYQFYKTIN